MLPGVYKVLPVALFLGVAMAQNPNEPHAAPTNPFPNDPQAITEGGEMFRVQCLPCHGSGGGRAAAPDLSRGAYAVGDRDEDLYRIISGGGRVMPAFGGALGEQSVWKLVNYVRSVSKPAAEKPTGNAAAGEQVFWEKGKCGQCHRVGFKGGSVGPELTKVGRSRSLQYLRTALIDPDADLGRGYATITVVTKDGKKLQGVQRGYDFFSAQFIDIEGNFHSYFKSDVNELTRAEKSLMPSYSKTLSPTEINDVVAFLYGLGR
jgi:putative heme-binding domain-containing protein